MLLILSNFHCEAFAGPLSFLPKNESLHEMLNVDWSRNVTHSTFVSSSLLAQCPKLWKFSPLLAMSSFRFFSLSFSYFFGFSTLQKGIKKDVVVVSKIPSFQICHPLKGTLPLKIRFFLFQSNSFGLIFLGSNNG